MARLADQEQSICQTNPGTEIPDNRSFERRACSLFRHRCRMIYDIFSECSWMTRCFDSRLISDCLRVDVSTFHRSP